MEENSPDNGPGIPTGRQRLESIRARRERGMLGSPRHAKNTVVINMAIEAVSAVIYLVGVWYAIRFLNIRRPFMEEMHFRIIVGVFLLVTVVWASFLVRRVLHNIQRYKDLSRMEEEV